MTPGLTRCDSVNEVVRALVDDVGDEVGAGSSVVAQLGEDFIAAKGVSKVCHHKNFCVLLSRIFTWDSC